MVDEAQVPTRSRVSLGARLAHYSPRLVFSLGVVQLVCGLVLILLSVLMLRLHRERALSWSLHLLAGLLPEVVRVAWLGAWVLLSGLIMLLGSARARSTCHLYLLLLSSLLTVAVTGAFAILISNHVIQYSVIAAVLSQEPPQTSLADEELRSERGPFDEHLARASPTLFFTFLMLCGCLVSFVISIACFSVVSHHLCSCSVLVDKLPAYHIYDTCTWSKKERIAQWVMQQSKLTDQSDLTDLACNNPLPCSQVLVASAVLSGNSTKLSLHDS